LAKKSKQSAGLDTIQEVQSENVETECKLPKVNEEEEKEEEHDIESI